MSYLDPQTAGGAALATIWKFSTVITATDPGAKVFKFDNATLASVLNIYINSTSNNKGDLDNILGFLASGDQIYVQQKDDSARVALFTVGTPVDNTGWWTLPVTVVGSDTLMVDGAECALLMNFGA